MKHLVLSILALFIAAAPLRIVAQSTPPKFLIFGEPVDPGAVWGDDQWDLIRWENIGDSLRFNMGTLRLNVNTVNDAAHIRVHLGQADAHRVKYTVPSGLPSGMYLMMLTTEYGVKTSVMMLAK